jgi:hypothetical protein
MFSRLNRGNQSITEQTGLKARLLTYITVVLGLNPGCIKATPADFLALLLSPFRQIPGRYIMLATTTSFVIH